MNAPYTGPLPRHEPAARWGWSGFADSEAGVLVGPGLIAASALAAWTPAAAGAAGFTAAVEFAGIPVAVVLGFFIHARGDLAAEFMRQSAQARKWRAWQLILALPGGTAIWALLLLVAYIAAAKGSEEGASGTAARCLAPLAVHLRVVPKPAEVVARGSVSPAERDSHDDDHGGGRVDGAHHLYRGCPLRGGRCATNRTRSTSRLRPVAGDEHPLGKAIRRALVICSENGDSRRGPAALAPHLG